MDKKLDCYGEDSGESDCWPGWVNIGVPVFMSISFVAILLIMFVFWPQQKKPENIEGNASDVSLVMNNSCHTNSNNSDCKVARL